MNKKIGRFLTVLFGAGLALNSFAQTNSTPGAPTAGIVAATQKFLATLDDAQRGKVVFDFKDEAQRKRWSNLPTAIFKRQGLRTGDLTKPQREAVLAVLAAALSPQGYEKVLQIVEATVSDLPRSINLTTPSVPLGSHWRDRSRETSLTSTLLRFGNESVPCRKEVRHLPFAFETPRITSCLARDLPQDAV